MKILLVGSGGREHALLRKLKESLRVTEVLCAPGNGGMACETRCFPVDAMDIPGMLALAKAEAVDLVFVAPDDPLAAGMVDAFEAAGIRAFGPRANAALIESSKVFSKNLMKKYGIPTADYAVFDDAKTALDYILAANQFPIVIKADGLALGKGVLIAESAAQAEEALRAILEEKRFGASGDRVVVEEFLRGPEVTVLAFTDGETVLPMVSSMDHKRALDGNRGQNTGGMGTISPNPYYDEKTAEQCRERIFLPTVAALRQEGRPFKGCLYFGLMLTEQGPKVIEYNARFGDPETQVVLPRLKTPLIDIIEAVIDERLDQLEIQWSEAACACVVMASGGYPERYAKGYEITGLDAGGQLEGLEIFHAGTKWENGRFYTNGGRVLGVTARGKNLEEARAKAYKGISRIQFQNAHYRTDIGSL